MRYRSANVESKMPFRASFSCNFCGNYRLLWIKKPSLPRIAAYQVGSWDEMPLFACIISDTNKKRNKAQNPRKAEVAQDTGFGCGWVSKEIPLLRYE